MGRSDKRSIISFIHFIGISEVSSSAESESSDSKVEEEVETTVRILFSRPRSSESSSNVGECQETSEMQIPTNEMTNDLIVPEDCKENYPSNMRIAVRNEDFIFHKAKDEVSLATPDQLQVSTEVKEMFPETAKNPATEITVNVLASGSSSENCSADVKSVDSKDDFILHKVQEEVSLAIEPIKDQNNVLKDVKEVFRGATRKTSTETLIDVLAPESGSYASELKNLETEDDFTLHKTKDKVSLVLTPILEHSAAKGSSVKEASYHDDGLEQEIQIPSVMEVMFSRRKQVPKTEVMITMMERKGCRSDFSNGLMNLVANDNSNFHKNTNEENLVMEASYLTECQKQEIQIPSVMEVMFPGTTQVPTSDATVDLTVPKDFKGNYGTQLVVTNDYCNLHDNKDGVSMTNETIEGHSDAKESPVMEDSHRYKCSKKQMQIPTVMEVMLPGQILTQIPAIETTIDVTAPRNCESSNSNPETIAVTGVDSNFIENKDEISTATEPIKDQSKATDSQIIEDSYLIECQISSNDAKEELQIPSLTEEMFLGRTEASTGGATIDLAVPRDLKSNDGVNYVVINNDFIFRDNNNEVPMADESMENRSKAKNSPVMENSNLIECCNQEMKVPSMTEKMFAGRTHTPAFETTINVTTPQGSKVIYPKVIKIVVTDEESNFHGSPDEVSISIEPIKDQSEAKGSPVMDYSNHNECNKLDIQTSSVTEGMFHERTRAPTMETTIDVTAPQGFEGIYPKVIKIVITDTDAECNYPNDNKKEHSMAIKPINDHCGPFMMNSDYDESHKKVTLTAKSEADDKEKLCSNEANKEPKEFIKQLEIEVLKEKVISLSDEAQIDKAKLLAMSRRMQQLKLGEDLRVRVLEKKENSEEELSQARINLRYQIEKNHRLEFRDELKERVLMKLEQVQTDYTELQKEHGTLLAEISKSTGSGDGNRYDRNAGKSTFKEVNKKTQKLL